MPFQEGNEYGGRQKGAVNKTTRAAREALASAIAGELEKVPGKLAEIKNPKDYIEALTKILPYIMPRLNAMNIDMSVDDQSNNWLNQIDFTLLPEQELKKILNAVKTQPNNDTQAEQNK